MLRDLPHWREPGRICQLAVPVAVGRAGGPPLDFAPLAEFATPERLERDSRHQVEMPEIGISGTDIRRRVSAGESIRYRRRGPSRRISNASALPDGGRKIGRRVIPVVGQAAIRG